MSFYAKYTGIFGGGGGGGGGTKAQEAPTGAIPGTVFVLAHTPNAPAGVTFMVDGIIWYQGVEYTIAGDTITTLTTVTAGQLPWAIYEY